VKLTGKQRRHLRALGHHLTPIVLLGKEGVSEGLVGATEAALLQHELIKVRLAEDDEREPVARELADATGAELVQILGRTVLLYKRHPEEPKIELPKA
jgi:RNA-binding protein